VHAAASHGIVRRAQGCRQRQNLKQECGMIGVFVTFRYAASFDAASVRTIAEHARAIFEGMPGLRSKAFTIDADRREAVNFYVWDTEDAARAFFDEALLQRVTGLYGVRPEVAFVQVAALVENACVPPDRRAANA
jgi:heme-degrading monooxygenase HmoA